MVYFLFCGGLECMTNSQKVPAASPQHPTDNSSTRSIPLSPCCHIGVRRSLISTAMERPASGVKCLEPKKPALAL